MDKLVRIHDLEPLPKDFHTGEVLVTQEFADRWEQPATEKTMTESLERSPRP